MTTINPAPDTSVVLVIGGVALALVVIAWPSVRMAITVCHEAGHAVAAMLTGRSLQGIRLHSDTSGVTLTRGKPKGMGMVVTLLAGYPSASLVGLAVAAGASAGHSVAVLGLMALLLALMFLKIRNLYGALVVLALGSLLTFATWYVPQNLLVGLVYGLAWVLLLAGPRPVVELALNRSRTTSNSDAAQLARLTRVPQLFWVTLWLVFTLGTLALGTVLLLPGAFLNVG